jgi:hypothetical protein
VLALRQAHLAAQARRLAESHVEALRRLGRDVIGGYGELVTHLPGGMQRKAALLGTLADYLEQLLQRSPDDAGVTAELALVHARLAHLSGRTNFEARPDAQALQRHAARASVLAPIAEAAQRLSPELAEAWALMLGDLAVHAQYAGELDAAERQLDTADALLQRALARHPGHDALLELEGQLLMLRAMGLAGWDRPSRQQPEAALSVLDRVDAVYSAAQARARRRGQGLPAYACFQRGTAASMRALMLARERRFEAARDAARQSTQWREQALALEPHNRTLAGGLVAERNLLAGLCLDLNDTDGALAASAPAWAALQRLIAEDPERASWQSQQRWLAFHHGRALLRSGAAESALPVLHMSADWLQAEAQAGRATPRLVLRWALSECALEAARRLLASTPSSTSTPSPTPRPGLAAARQALQAQLQSDPSDDDTGRALVECDGLLAAQPAPS